MNLSDKSVKLLLVGTEALNDRERATQKAVVFSQVGAVGEPASSWRLLRVFGGVPREAEPASESGVEAGPVGAGVGFGEEFRSDCPFQDAER